MSRRINWRRINAPIGLYRCIYCRRTGDARFFNREHVLSKAWGRFRDALVLHRCVCRDCNAFLGKELELKFARGAYEGMLRYRHAIKTPPRLRYVTLAIPPGSDWSGVL